jgi:DNA-binding NarL/FixJ family response regulator
VNDSTTRVLVADDQVLVRAGVAALLAQMDGFECAGTVESGAQCLAACEADTPDIVLLDLNMPGEDGLSVAQRLRESHPALRIVILTGRAEAGVARRALALGAQGFVSKDFVLDELALALRTVAAGRSYISPEIAVAAVQAPAPAPGGLTPRQRDVLRGIARGASNKLIARDLGVSVKTVEYHRAELIQRLDLHDVASLTRFAVQHGLAD